MAGYPTVCPPAAASCKSHSYYVRNGVRTSIWHCEFICWLGQKNWKVCQGPVALCSLNKFRSIITPSPFWVLSNSVYWNCIWSGVCMLAFNHSNILRCANLCSMYWCGHTRHKIKLKLDVHDCRIMLSCWGQLLVVHLVEIHSLHPTASVN